MLSPFQRTLGEEIPHMDYPSLFQENVQIFLKNKTQCKF